MKKVTVYTTQNCRYCEAAKKLLKERGIQFSEVKVNEDDDKAWADLYQRSGMRTVPQIYADEELVGGYEDLAKLDKTDKLKSIS